MNFDAVIKNIKIIDGSGRKRYSGEIGIEGDTIKAAAEPGAIKNVKAGCVVIDGGGSVLSPGFIDIHSHDDAVVWSDPFNEPKLRQGVTTVVTGMCGYSVFPAPEGALRRPYGSGGVENILCAGTIGSLGEYVRRIEECRPGINLIPAVGHGAVRSAVIGYSARCPSRAELEKMKGHLRNSLKDGAVGMSTGLIYPPGSYADTNELKELADLLGEYGGIYFTHLRSEGVGMPGAVEEAEKICSRSKTQLHISHFKCLGVRSWGNAEKRLSLAEKVRDRGLKISWDQYPYTAGSTFLSSLLPSEVYKEGPDKLLEEIENSAFRRKMTEKMKEDCVSWENFYFISGGWEKIIIADAPGYEELEGASIAESAEKTGEDPFSLVFEVIKRTRAAAVMVVLSMSDEDVERIMKHSSTSIGSDGIPGRGKVHPRLFGAFPRLLGLYAREKRLFPLEEAVHRMTSLPAGTLGLKDRGLIKEGYKADIVIFNPDTVKDTATYSEPRRHPEGISHIFVNGRPVIIDGILGGERPGRVLLKT